MGNKVEAGDSELLYPIGDVARLTGVSRVAAPMAYFPFSGAKSSFFGTLHPQDRDVVRFYTESKVVITRWTPGDRTPVVGVGR